MCLQTSKEIRLQLHVNVLQLTIPSITSENYTNKKSQITTVSCNSLYSLSERSFSTQLWRLKSMIVLQITFLTIQNTGIPRLRAP